MAETERLQSLVFAVWPLQASADVAIEDTGCVAARPRAARPTPPASQSPTHGIYVAWPELYAPSQKGLNPPPSSSRPSATQHQRRREALVVACLL